MGDQQNWDWEIGEKLVADLDEWKKNNADVYDEVVSPGFVAMYWGIAFSSLERTLFDIAPRVKQPVFDKLKIPVDYFRE